MPLPLIPDERASRASMICRIWHGWNSAVNTDAYERLLRSEIFTGMAARRIPGYHGIELLRRSFL